MGMTAFEERRRAQRAAEAPRVVEGSAPIGTPEQEAAAVEQLREVLEQKRAALTELTDRLGIPTLNDGDTEAAGATVTPEDLLLVSAAESDVIAAEASLAHAEEALALSQGKVETGVPLSEKVETGTAGTEQTTQELGNETSPADRVDEISTSTGSEVSESEPKAEPGTPTSDPTPAEAPTAEAAPNEQNTRPEIDAYAAARGIDTSGEANKGAALARIAKGA